ncbi:MAG: hypothetical protein J0L64_25185 [Acidobacteria bacterium]|nr:hypothetical protein [Acidobacteriota bacterium]
MLRIYLPLLLGAALFFLVLGLRFLGERNRPNQRPATWSRRAKLARILVGAAIALYAITRNLDNLSANIGP